MTSFSEINWFLVGLSISLGFAVLMPYLLDVLAESS
jgi:hypothetical protein